MLILLYGLHSETCRKARRKTDAEHWRVSSGSHGKRDGSVREAQEKRELAKSWLIAVRDRAPPTYLEYVVELLAKGVSHRRSFRYTTHCLGRRDLL